MKHTKLPGGPTALPNFPNKPRPAQQNHAPPKLRSGPPNMVGLQAVTATRRSRVAPFGKLGNTAPLNPLVLKESRTY